MIDTSKLVGKYVHIIQNGDYPVFLFDIQSIDSDSGEVIAKQILDSPNSDDLEVYCGPEWELDLNNDTVAGIYDTAEELFARVCDFLKDQIDRCSGIQIK